MTNKSEQQTTAENQDTALDPIWEAAKEGNWDTVKECLQRDPSLITAIYTWEAGGRMSLLHLAIRRQRKADISFLEYLVSLGADVNALSDGKVYESVVGNSKYVCRTPPPLHFAFLNDNMDAVKFLISHGVDVNAKDRDGKTLLHYIADRQQDPYDTETAEMLEYFLSVGADINAKNKKGDTPLHLAYKYSGGGEMLKYLISKGADVDAKNDNGLSLQDELDDLDAQIEEMEEDLAELEERRDMLREAMGRE